MDTIGGWLSNLFQPRGARFTAEYECSFVMGDKDFMVNILLIGTKAFAVHTQWVNLQIIPSQYVRDESSGKGGYGVFKYLRSN